MDLKNRRWWFVIGAALLIVLVVSGILLGSYLKNKKAFESRPLVLIHEPGYDAQFHVGDGVIVHATATEDNGLARIELWVNDLLIDAAEAEEPDVQDLVLFSSWVPTYEGEQQIIVRAFSSDEVSGQSSIRINVVEAKETGALHIVEEGETLESIAEEYGTSPEEIEDLNPGLGANGPAPGDGLILPDGEPEAEESSAPPLDEGEPPVFGGAPALVESTFSISDLIPSSEPPLLLRVEIPRLETGASYEKLHCYLGLANHLPQWYPDRDHNQATDESFESLGGGRWNPENILVGSALPLIIWPSDEPLPATMNCVGITGGGTESVEFGQLDIEILPVWWTGVRRTFAVDGAGGHLEVDVRVSRYNGGSRLTPKVPDPDMEVPSNLRLDEEDRILGWDYSEEGQAGILGFQVFLNGNLLWSEEPHKRDSRMPAEWFRPPCDSSYTFGVQAYRYDEEDDEFYESYMEEITIRPPGDACVRQLQITFLSLETFDLGDDGDHEDRMGDVGPAYGSFYANRARFSFDQRSEGTSLGLEHYTLYGLSDVAAHSDWDASGPNSVITDLPEGRTLRVGFRIMDQDGNRDDVICEGRHAPLFEEIVNFDEVFTSTIVSDNRQCDVRFEIRPGPDSPVGVAGEGGEPLPWLDWSGEQNSHYVIEGESRGELTLGIRNTGTAGWSGQDLTIGLFTREGEFIREVTIPDFDLPVGELEMVTHEDLRVPPPHDFCIQLDLYDEVLELHERTGNLTHTIECPDLPDLELRKATYEYNPIEETANMRVEVKNVGPVELHDRTLHIEIRDPEGDLIMEETFPRVSHLRSWDTRYFQFANVSDSLRERMVDGYTVTINPGHDLVESSYENNSYTVGPATRLSVAVTKIWVPESAHEIVEIEVDGYIQTGRFIKSHPMDFDISSSQSWSCDDYSAECNVVLRDSEYFENWFEIYGDEDFLIAIDISHRGTRAGGGSLLDNFSGSYLYSGPTWYAGSARTRRICSYEPARDHGGHVYSFYDWAGREWAVRLDVCRENYDE